MEDISIKVTLERRKSKLPVIKVISMAKLEEDTLKYLLTLILEILTISEFYKAEKVVSTNINDMYGQCDNGFMAVSSSLRFKNEDDCISFCIEVKEFLECFLN